MALLTVSNLSYKNILKIDHLDFENDKFYALIGPNGAGKTTLLRFLAFDEDAPKNTVFYQNKPLEQFTAKDLAQKRAVLSQQNSIAFSLFLQELIALGREAHLTDCLIDEKVCDFSANKMELSHLIDRKTHQLSGGEQQRGQIARVLAQSLLDLECSLNNHYLLLDEPSNHLDLRHQQQLFILLKQLQQRGLTIIAILHDPALALNLADEIILLKNGMLFDQATPEKIYKNQLLDQLFNMQLRLNKCGKTGQYYVNPSFGL